MQEVVTLQIDLIIPSFPPFPSFLSLPLQGTLRMIHVSVDQGESWNMAQLPPVGHEQFYSILAANDEMVFMHVDEPGGQSQKPPLVILYIIKQSIMCDFLYSICETICFFFLQTQDLAPFLYQMTGALCIPSHWSVIFTPPRGVTQISLTSPPCEEFSFPVSWLKVAPFMCLSLDKGIAKHYTQIPLRKHTHV